MIPLQTFETYAPFASNGTKSQPEPAKYAAGFQQSDVLPAEWLNWAWNRNTVGITDLNRGVTSIENEILAVLTEAGVTACEATTNQLVCGIVSIINKCNAGSACKLKTSRIINGTSFNGTQDVTTCCWGTARNISISDSDGVHTGTAVCVNGSGAVTLKLPATIKASLCGSASCFNGCTYECAKADIRSGLTGCTGTVTVANTECNTDLPVALCTGEKSIGKSNVCGLTFNPQNGILKSSYIRASVILKTDNTENLPSPDGTLHWIRLGKFLNNAQYSSIIFKIKGTDFNAEYKIEYVVRNSSPSFVIKTTGFNAFYIQKFAILVDETSPLGDRRYELWALYNPGSYNRTLTYYPLITDNNSSFCYAYCDAGVTEPGGTCYNLKNEDYILTNYNIITNKNFCGNLCGHAGCASCNGSGVAFGTAATSNTGTAAGCIPTIGTAFSACVGHLVATDANGKLQSIAGISVYCGTTCKCAVSGATSLCLSANAFNTNAVISMTTYPGACCTGTLSRCDLPSSSTGVYDIAFMTDASHVGCYGLQYDSEDHCLGSSFGNVKLKINGVSCCSENSCYAKSMRFIQINKSSSPEIIQFPGGDAVRFYVSTSSELSYLSSASTVSVYAERGTYINGVFNCSSDYDNFEYRIIYTPSFDPRDNAYFYFSTDGCECAQTSPWISGHDRMWLDSNANLRGRVFECGGFTCLKNLSWFPTFSNRNFSAVKHILGLFYRTQAASDYNPTVQIRILTNS